MLISEGVLRRIMLAGVYNLSINQTALINIFTEISC
jgi:hypothetical protein